MNEKADVDQGRANSKDHSTDPSSVDEFAEQPFFDHLNHRTKRSYSLKRNIEILVVVDILMNRYHGDNLQNYIYTIMSSVSNKI